MNAEEGVSLFKMVVTVLLVVLVVGAVVALVYGAYSWFNSGTSKLTDQVASIDKSAFSNYDDTTISGVDVLSALKTYRESEIGIFIVNKNNQSGGLNTGSATGQKLATSCAGTTETTVRAYNYCALQGTKAGDGKVTAISTDSSGNYAATLKSKTSGTLAGCWTLEDGLAWDSDTGILTRNTNFSPTTTKSMTTTYVNQSASWYCKLVYDASTNDICGLLFVQMN